MNFTSLRVNSPSPPFPVPTDLVFPLISSKPLETPLPPSSSSPHPLLLATSSLPSTPTSHLQRAAVKAIASLYAAATNPILLVDALAERFGAEDLVLELAESTGMKIFVSPMGKSAIDEGHPLFGGIYAGNVTQPGVAKLVESADLVIDVGPLKVCVY